MSAKIPKPSVDELTELYGQVGSTISSMAKHYNTSQPTVRKWLIGYGIQRKSQEEASREANNRLRNAIPPRRELLELYKYNSIDYIESVYGVGQATVYMWLDHYDIRHGDRKILNSRGQRELFKMITDRDPNGKWRMGDRTLIYPQELDIISDERKIAIEYCGLYWHSEVHKDKMYHIRKLDQCLARGYSLYTVFEDDDVNQVINFISKPSTKINARSCDVIEEDLKVFEDQHHLMGSCKAKIQLALVHQGCTVLAMSFSRSRFESDHQWELVRYTTGDVAVVGGAERLFKYFLRNYNPQSIISYSDRRFSKGLVYAKLGFQPVGVTSPNYWYVKRGGVLRLSRQKFQKHKLSKLLASFDPTLSEHQNMLNNKYVRVYDCGSQIWSWKFHQEETAEIIWSKY